MRKLLLSAMALVLGLFTVTAGLAFAIVPPVLEDTWHYTGGDNPNEFNERDNWDPGLGEDTCGPEQDLPCQIVDVEEGDLQALLDANPGLQIFDIASSKAATP